MSFFNREDEESGGSAAAGADRGRGGSPGEKTTYIASGARVEGEVTGSTELVIDGTVAGRVELERSVVIGPSGMVDGEIVAQSVRIGGKVVGNVRGLGVVELLATGSVEGDVAAPRVIIADGAFFKGNVEMTEQGARQVPAQPASGREGGSRR